MAFKKRRKVVAKRKRKSTSSAPKKRKSLPVKVDEILPPLAEQPKAVGSCAIGCFTFEEALQVEPLLRGVAEAHINQTSEFLKANGGDLLAVGLQGAQCVVEQGAYLVKFAPEVAKKFQTQGLRLMTDKSGQQLAVLVGRAGSNSKEVIQAQARLVGPLTKGTRVAASVGAAFVSVAHIVAGADTCRKLEKVSDKADFLVAVHRINQIAKVESIYRQARELTFLEMDDRGRQEIHRLGRELFEVRSAWRQELQYHLGRLSRRKDSKNFIRRFFERRAIDKHDKKTASSISNGMIEIQLIRASFAIHLALAQAAQTTDVFLSVTLRDELADLRKLSECLHKSRSLINTRNQAQRKQAKEVCDFLDSVRKVYGEMLRPIPPRLPLKESFKPSSLRQGETVALTSKN